MAGGEGMAQANQNNEPNQTKTMKLEIETQAYNERRYGKPWIATVDFSTGAKGEFAWGEWVGDPRNGSSGILLIDASPGDIIARGQKDHRQMRNSAPDWYQVAEDGTLTALPGPADAYRAWRTQQAAAPVAA